MKLLIIFITLFSVNALASFDCTNKRKHGFQVLAIERVGEPSTLTILQEGKEIYHKPVVVSHEARDVVKFRSLAFTNDNDAPAELFLTVYTKDVYLALAVFGETSFLPVVPQLQFTCKSLR